MFIVIINAYSNGFLLNICLICTKTTKTITTKTTIKVLLEYFFLWGIPKKLVTDNRPSLYAVEMEEFLRNNGVVHIITPPYNPSNGAAENSVSF